MIAWITSHLFDGKNLKDHFCILFLGGFSFNCNFFGRIKRYKLDAVTEDATGTMNVMIFDEPAQGLVGVPAEVLTDEVTPDNISAVVGSGPCRAFEVAFENGRFVVKCFLNDDMLQLLVQRRWQQQVVVVSCHWKRILLQPPPTVVVHK